MKKRFSEEQIIGFLKEADAGMPVVELCRKHVFPMPPIISGRQSLAAWTSPMPSGSRCCKRSTASWGSVHIAAKTAT